MGCRFWKPAWGGLQCAEALILSRQHVVKSYAIFQASLPNSGETLCIANGLPRLPRRCTSLFLHRTLCLSTLKCLRCNPLGYRCGFVFGFFGLDGHKSFQNLSPNRDPCLSSTVLLGKPQRPVFWGHWGCPTDAPATLLGD